MAIVYHIWRPMKNLLRSETLAQKGGHPVHHVSKVRLHLFESEEEYILLMSGVPVGQYMRQERGVVPSNA